MSNHLFKKIADEVKLSVEEREKMRLVLSEYMKMKPARSPIKSMAAASPIAFLSLRYVFAGSLAAILVITSGVSYAAEGALPGDVLYAVKISVLEEVRGAITLSSESKADWEARRAERRLEEAQILAVEGRLNEEIKVEIEENFNAHAKRVEVKIAELEESGDEDKAELLSTRFEVALSAHEAVLSKLALEDGEETKTLAEDIRAKVKLATASATASAGVLSDSFTTKSPSEKNIEATSLMMVEDATLVSEEASSSPISGKDRSEKDKRELPKEKAEVRLSVVEKQKASASREISLVESLLKSEESFREQVFNRAKNQLEKARDLFKKGEEAFLKTENKQSFEFFKESYKIAYELRVYLKAKTRLNLDITPLIVNPDTADDSRDTEPFNPSQSSGELKKIAENALKEAKEKLSEKVLRDRVIVVEAGETIKNAGYLFNRGSEALEDGEEASANRYFNASFTESLKAKVLLDIREETSSTSTDNNLFEDSADSVEDEVKKQSETETEEKTEGENEKAESGEQKSGLKSILGI